MAVHDVSLYGHAEVKVMHRSQLMNRLMVACSYGLGNDLPAAIMAPSLRPLAIIAALIPRLYHYK